MFYFRKIVTVLFVCVNISYCKHLPQQDAGYKENYNELHIVNGEQNDKLKAGFKNKKNNKGTAELHERESYESVHGFELRPDWKIKTSQTNSFSYEGLLPDEDANLNSGADLEKPNKIQVRSVDLKITKKQETCFHTVQDEIANLFDENFNASKSIFPLCCKTQTKCLQRTTKCKSVPKTSPKCTQKRQEHTLQPKITTNLLKQLIPTTVHHKVSNEAVVNVVIHVECDHPEAREHVLPKTISLNPPHLLCPVTKDLSRSDFKDSKFNFSVNVLNSQKTEVTKYSIFKTKDSSNEMNLDEEPLIKKYDNSSPDELSGGGLFGEQDTITEENCKNDLKSKYPHPLLPHDITVQITKPTNKPRATSFPEFICQMTPRFCNFTVTKSVAKSVVLTRSVKPGFTLWKKINLPRLWHSIPPTQNNDCQPKTDSRTVEPTCRGEKMVDQTTEESCSPDLNDTEEPSVNSCEVVENSNTDADTPESVTCESNLNNNEQTDSSTLVRDESNESGLAIDPFPGQCDPESTRTVVPSFEPCQLSSTDLDQTPIEPCNGDTECLQVVTEPDQSSAGCEEFSTEPIQPYTKRGQSVMEMDRPQLTEYVSPFVESNQPVESHKTPDTLNTPQPGRGSAENVLLPDNQVRPTVQVEGFGFPTQENSNVVTTSKEQNLPIPGHSSTGVLVTEPASLLSFFKTDSSPNTQNLLLTVVGPFTMDSLKIHSSTDGLTIHPGSTTRNDNDTSSTEIATVNVDLFGILKSTKFTENLSESSIDKSSEEYKSTISVEKLIEKEQSSVEGLTTSASERAAQTVELTNEGNNETTVSYPLSTVMIEDSSGFYTGSETGISSVEIVKENEMFLTTTETLSSETPTGTESAFTAVSLQKEHLSTVEELSGKITEDIIESIIELSNNSYLFYRNHKWFISNSNHLWNFDEGTVEIVNDTFTKISKDHSNENSEKNKDIINHVFNQIGAYNESEEVPFEIFVQAILLYSEFNRNISTFEWSGIYFSVNEMIAMLRITNFDSFSANEWGSVNWMTIYRLVKESSNTMSPDENEYYITDVDGSIHSLILFSNGSSVWNNVKLDIIEILSIIENLNRKTDSFKQIINVPYTSNDPSLMSFVKHVFEQRINSNVTYSGYEWESNTYSWDEILALLVMTSTTLKDITNLETSMRQNWDDFLVKFRNSKRHYYTDRVVYDISFDSETKPMTVFTNGTTDFDGQRFTIDEVGQRIRDFTVSEIPTLDVQHVINLGGGKLQFYWNNKWYITDHTHIWRFEDRTSALMNESFFSIPEDLTVNRDSVQELLADSSFSNNFEMPFELFAQTILTATTYSEDVLYQWGGYFFSYADIFAMLRLSDFNSFNVQTQDYKWGQTNWYGVYDKVKQSPKSTSSDLQAYEVLDFDGSSYPLIVFSNGTSIWKHSKLDFTESLTTLQNLNSESHFPDIVTVSSYISSADSFLSFMTGAIEDRVHNRILHSFYVWKNYQFTWEDLEAINRILLQHYESKLANDFSFSNIALPILNSTKQVFPNRTEFQVNLGSENKPLIVYSNGSTEYDNVRSEFTDTVQQVEELKKSSNMTFKEDWVDVVTKLQEENTNNAKPVDDNSIKGGVHSYDWKMLNNNPYFNVCYPINLGGGKVQFYMKNTWFITDGENVWPFENPLTSFYINEMVKKMNQSFTDDPRLDKTNIQDLVDKKQTLKGAEVLLMPHELIIQHYLFFVKSLDHQVAFNISQDIIYQREKLHIISVHLLIALRLSAFNNFTTKEVELSWEKGKKLNWDWFFFLGKKSERIKVGDEWKDRLNTSYFDEFRDTPLLDVYSNFSSDWGGQRLEIDQALLKVQKANEGNTFLPVEVNGEFKSKNESFEGLYKEALKTRFENKRTYSKYKWLTDSVSWFDILIAIRYPEAKAGAVQDNMFWKTAIKVISRAWKSKYSDRVEYEIGGIESDKDVIMIIYMNESTVLNGKKMDIEEYRVLLR